ncbi:MAG: beta-ketoacyl-ACP synthase [Kiritimatiellae bacterium]|nr:beta-ketoacyl-ACP synthase [Kiritimatiellia bacterium]
MSRRRVVVTGMGVVSPLGNTVDAAFARLKTFENCVQALGELGEYTGLNTRLGCRTAFERPAHWTRKTTRTMGDVSMYALAATEQAIAESGLDEATIQGGRTGVAYGSCSGSIPALLDFYSMLKTKEVAGITSGTYIKLMPQTTACNLSVHFRTHGRLVPTGTACTSGSLAIGSAAELIRWGVQDVMIAGGAEEFSATQVAIFDTLYATSLRNDAPKSTPAPYDVSRDGLVIGDGAATFILEEREHAIARGARILAEVAGFAETTDGTHVTNPNAETMASALALAIADAGIDGSAVGYVSGHGTATRAGDVAETSATRAALARAVPISSVKSYTGHTLGACGALEAALLLKSLECGWYPPTLNLEHPDPGCAELDYVTGEGRMIDAEYVMSNNFAFGGVNTSLVFRR